MEKRAYMSLCKIGERTFMSSAHPTKYLPVRHLTYNRELKQNRVKWNIQYT